MARPALDPDRPNNTAVASKLPPADASWLAELATAAGITKSELIRRIIAERRRRDTAPP
jgi:hypothetical protein